MNLPIVLYPGAESGLPKIHLERTVLVEKIQVARHEVSAAVTRLAPAGPAGQAGRDRLRGAVPGGAGGELCQRLCARRRRRLDGGIRPRLVSEGRNGTPSRGQAPGATRYVRRTRDRGAGNSALARCRYGACPRGNPCSRTPLPCPIQSRERKRAAMAYGQACAPPKGMNTGGFSTEWSGRLPTDSGAGTQQSRRPKPAVKAAIYHEQFGAANASERPWASQPTQGDETRVGGRQSGPGKPK